MQWIAWYLGLQELQEHRRELHERREASQEKERRFEERTQEPWLRGTTTVGLYSPYPLMSPAYVFSVFVVTCRNFVGFLVHLRSEELCREEEALMADEAKDLEFSVKMGQSQ